MELVIKSANKGKTTELIQIAIDHVAEGNNVMFFSTEEDPEVILSHMVGNGLNTNNGGAGAVHIKNIKTAKDATSILEIADTCGHDISVVILDVNFAMSRPEWLNLVVKLENDFYIVAGSQNLVVANPTETASELFNVQQINDIFKSWQPTTVPSAELIDAISKSIK